MHGCGAFCRCRQVMASASPLSCRRAVNVVDVGVEAKIRAVPGFAKQPTLSKLVHTLLGTPSR